MVTTEQNSTPVNFRVPAIAFPDLMSKKSNCYVLDVRGDDPSTTFGATNTLKSMVDYVPTISPCGQVRKKTVVFGDQGLVEKFRKAVVSRAEEQDPCERFSCYVLQPQDWHAQKENLTIWRQHFDLPHQLAEEGSISHFKLIFSHSQADWRCKQYYANDSLMRVVTEANLIALLQEQQRYITQKTRL